MATFHVANHSKIVNKIKRFTVDNVKLSDDTEQLKLEVAKKLNTSPSGIELIYCGRCLKEGRTLDSHHLKAGVTIHVLDKVLQKIQPSKVPAKKLDAAEIQQLVLALRTAIMNPAYRETIQRLSKPDVLENIMAATPGLAEDPVAIAILQDPDLLLHLTDINSINRVVEAHPALADAVNHIVAAVHEEAGSSTGNTAQMLSSYLYSLDALSDDDDDVESSSQTEPGSSSASASSLQPDFSQLSFAGITQAQLASALASAVAGTSSLSSAMTGSQLSHPNRGHGSSDSAITPELFQQAVQQAMSAQLQQLRDMGINDDALSIRALEITGGDVHAALELIFGDFMTNNSGGGAAPSQ